MSEQYAILIAITRNPNLTRFASIDSFNIKRTDCDSSKYIL
jgi:hypothetical protein